MGMRSSAAQIRDEIKDLDNSSGNSIRVDTILGELERSVTAGKVGQEHLEQLKALAEKAYFAVIQNRCAELGIETRFLSPDRIIGCHQINEPDKHARLVQAINQRSFVPPIIVYDGGKDRHLLLEGHHRRQAHEDLNREAPCIIIRSDRELSALISSKVTYIGWLKRFVDDDCPLSNALKVVSEEGRWPDEDDKEQANYLIESHQIKAAYLADYGSLLSNSELTALAEIAHVAKRSIEGFLRVTQAEGDNFLEIYLCGSEITDIGPLSNLARLKKLSLLSKIRDMTPLMGLTALTSLFLDGFIDIRTLSGLKRLEELSLRGTEFEDLTPLAKLKNLRYLNLSGTSVKDLTPLRKLTKLEHLDLGGTQVEDLTPLARLTNLKELDLGGAKLVEDLTPLAKLTKLQVLDLRATSFKDITPLSGLTELTSLLLAGVLEDETPLSMRKEVDIGPLSGLKRLEELSLGGITLEDLTPLAKLKNLRELDLSDTSVEDLTPLARLKNLRVLQLYGTLVQDISTLLALPKLRTLSGLPETADNESNRHLISLLSGRGVERIY
jgi:Leucine-rich repeat (LRR) protein